MKTCGEIALLAGDANVAEALAGLSGQTADELRLHVMPSDPAARETLQTLDAVEEVWVAAADGLGAINLAAALKADRPARRVYLVDCEETGSVRSRMHAAALDGVRSMDDLADALQRRVADGNVEMPAGRRAAVSPSGAPVASAVGVAAETSAAVGVASSRTPEARIGRAGAGFLMTVVSGSGGAGKSTVSTLAAHLACRRGLRTALLDADLQFGDLRDLAGPCSRVPLEALAADAAALEAVVEAPLVLVEAPRRLEVAEAVGAGLASVVDVLASQFDFVVANTGAAWDEQRLMLLERSLSTVFLVDQRASSVRACRHALDVCLRCGVATGSFLLAVNRCSRHAPLTSIDVSSALHGAHVVELAEGGREVEELLGAGMADALAASRNPLCASIDRLLDEVLPAAGRGERGADAPARSETRFALGSGRRRESGRRRGRREARARRGSRKEAVSSVSAMG